MEELTGGRASSIYRDGDVVYRPLQPWSATVHQLLTHLERLNVHECPRVLGVTDDQELLSFVAGDTYNYPLVGPIASAEALMSAATLLRKIHDATVSLLFATDPSITDITSATHIISTTNIVKQPWMLAPREPFEVICHGDFTPYNVTLENCTVVGVFDFDTAHPAPRVWDLAYSVYCWAPFKTNRADRLGTITEQIARAKLFCDSYGATGPEREQLAEMMVKRLAALVDFMRQAARDGHPSFAENIEQGHLQAYLNDIEYIDAHQHNIQRALCDVLPINEK
ncbi:aminoglycoside phosphotransferase family protein [Vibrio rhizosphaerae]|uniref:Aminoglycoside phosphotransferase family protein n=1 Tax=Vibrio rhizosphaerae TaxID=398736 RepID=A0ABU4IZN5_9VIBR|nr:aminoglycoside phosphotransferase family protein [Vibrio rhizosphaerae]MDW6094810.1 aminoglycoside phosphotransferase family protein [Vibrio rhizosphaerae]